MSAFRIGIVKEQDAERGRVRVTFADYDQMTSWWLFVVAPKTQDDKAYWMPDAGEQVVCLMDEHDEDGAVLGAVYSQADTTPVQSADKWHVAIKDGAVFEYDRSSHELKVELPKDGKVTITANQATIQIDTDGTVNLTAKTDIKLTTNEGATSVNQIVDTYNSHTHNDPQGGVTAVPNQVIGSFI